MVVIYNPELLMWIITFKQKEKSKSIIKNELEITHTTEEMIANNNEPQEALRNSTAYANDKLLVVSSVLVISLLCFSPFRPCLNPYPNFKSNLV